MKKYRTHFIYILIIVILAVVSRLKTNELEAKAVKYEQMANEAQQMALKNEQAAAEAAARATEQTAIAQHEAMRARKAQEDCENSKK